MHSVHCNGTVARFHENLHFAIFCPSVLLSKKHNRKIIIQDMKKTYVSPLMTEVNIEAAQMLAASLKIGSDDQTVDTSADGAQLGGGRRGEWGNLWQ